MPQTDASLEAVAAAVIQGTLRSLPEALSQAVSACVIEAVNMRDCLAAGDDLEDDLLGVFEGVPLTDPEPESPAHLPRIRLFVDNLWEFVEQDMPRFREEVRITLLHELGHYLGYNEEQIADRGLE